MTITAKMVRDLREATGAAMMKCKKALEETGGDLDAATDLLRKQGLQSAQKKAGRETGEGQVLALLSEDGRRGHLVGVACETDFLKNTEKFGALMKDIEATVVASDPTGLEDGERPLLACTVAGGDQSVAERVQAAIGDLGENIQITACERLENPEGRVGCYVHHDEKQAGLASITTPASADDASATLKALCQHIVVFKPEFGTRDEVSQEAIERERSVILESDDVQKKPEQFREKIVEGRMAKFFAESVLEEQPWIHDDKSSVSKAITAALGDGSRFAGFARVAIGG
jgi:elongation factor Ts